MLIPLMIGTVQRA